MDDTEELVDINAEKYQADTLERSHCTNYLESVTSATNMAGRTDDENGPERIGPFSRTELWIREYPPVKPSAFASWRC